MASEERSRRDSRSRSPHGPGPMRGPVEHAKDAKGTFQRLLAYIKPEGPKFVFVLLCAIAATVFDVFAPMQLGRATTTVYNGVLARMNGTGGVDFDALTFILATVIALYLAFSLFTYFQMFVMARITQNIVYNLRRDAENKLNRLPLSYYDSHSKGDTLSRVVNDVDLISSTLQDSLTQGVTAVIGLVGTLAMMVSISPLMMLIALCTLPFSIFTTVFVAKRTQKLYLAQQTSLGELDAHIEETYGGHTEVVAFTHETEAVEQFERVNNEYFAHAWKAQFFSGLVRPLMMLIGNLGYVAVCVFGAWQVTQGAIAVGDIQAFIQYMRNFTRPIAQIANIINVIQATLAGAERVFELMDEPEMEGMVIHDAVPAKPKRVEGHVEFDHVRFGYTPEKPVIKDFSLDVKPGQTVAIVGPTGAGKTTLVNLLMRFYDIDAGSIRLDGVDTREIGRHELRGHFGMVLQDTWLFNGTIRDNIAYGVDVTDDEQIERVALATNVDHFVRCLPEGYDTVINEEATNISAGQRQLLTIARALLADPEILILDEATSSIDTRTEHLVQQAMQELMVGRTSFVIAHRLSTIREADLILVLNEGDIVEQGTHDELLAREGFYAELYNSQFSG